jgi:hypothetical protein
MPNQKFQPVQKTNETLVQRINACHFRRMDGPREISLARFEAGIVSAATGNSVVLSTYGGPALPGAS